MSLHFTDKSEMCPTPCAPFAAQATAPPQKGVPVRVDRFRARPSQRLRVTAAFATAALALLATLGLGGGAARAQTVADPPQKPNMAPTSPILLSTEKQSPLNAYPNGGGNAQNRAWGGGDVYWGVADGDVPFGQAPLARISDYNAAFMTDGWTLPRRADIDNYLFGPLPSTDPGSFNRAVAQALTATATIDGEPPTAAAPAPVGAVAWQIQAPPTPSNNVTSAVAGVPAYFDAVAYPRPATSAVSYNATNKFVWRLDNPIGGPTVVIPGVAGAQVRYRIFVHIPSPTVPPGTATATGVSGPENRIDDARYTVYYYVVSNGVYYARQQVCILSQVDGGDYVLNATDGSTAVFPFFSTNTFTAKGVDTLGLSGGNAQPAGTPGAPPIVQGVAIDNTTGDSGAPLFVAADSITLTPSFDTVTATPTVTPPHGGALHVKALASQGGIPIQSNEYLPDSPDPLYNNATTVAPHQADPNNVYGDTSGKFSYANDINDPQYGGAGYATFVPWDISTTFQGPRSLIDPRFVGTDVVGNIFASPGAQIGAMVPYLSTRPKFNLPANPLAPVAGQNILRPGRASDATNNGVYPAPYFSHMQVLIAKTQFVQDPENGVNPANRTGIKTIQVGAIYALDWQTGAPVWRFPDRTYLPAGALANGAAIPQAGLRNALVGFDSAAQQPVFTVPGIVAVDVNGDGKIADDEVFLGATQLVNYGGKNYNVTAGANTNGGVSASVTVAPRVLVQGVVQVPVHDLTWTPAQLTIQNGTQTDIAKVSPATPGRYYNPAANNFGPVPVGMAYIAAGNGVLYAVDAYGNNDTRYFAGPTITAAGPYLGGTYFGTYQAGTTNLFWSFSATSHGQQPASGITPAETTLKYNQRVQGEVPATSSFGASAPVLAWNLTDSEMALATPPSNPELRLFVGNTNGVVYAMDPTAQSGLVTMKDAMGNITVTGTNPLPFIKGGQPDSSYYGLNTFGGQGTDPVSGHQSELRWWYRTQGSINFAASVSPYRHDMSGFNSGPIEKGVYVTSSEGRVYCIDWDGPSTLSSSADLGLLGATSTSGGLTAYDGSAATAKTLNNDIYFHNSMPAFNNGIADTTQGIVRPRWVYPNLYRANTGSGGKLASDPTDPGLAQGVAGVLLAEPSALGPIKTAPVLMDFWWQDPDTSNPPTLLDYVAIVANDPATAGAPGTESRVYLLDQIGDRQDYLTNPRSTASAGAGGRAISQARDRYSPHVLMASPNDPTIASGLTWTYRYQYDAYPALLTVPQKQDTTAIQLRNVPLFDMTAIGDYNSNTNSFDPLAILTVPAASVLPPATGTLTEYVHQPSRRMLPTLFAGGIGEIYGIDIDPETGVFMRWRPSVAAQEQFTPLPNRMITGADLYPGDPTTTGTMSTDDQLFPLDHTFDAATTTYGYARSALGTQEILARRLRLDVEQSAVTAMTVSGGPTQDQNNIIPENGNAQPMPSVPSRPTNDIPNLLPFAIATVQPQGSVGGFTTVKGGNGATIGQTAASSTVDFNGLAAAPLVGTSLTLGGHVTGAVNQDINDPITNTAGRINSNSGTTIASGPGLPALPVHVPNAAFQFPIIFVSTISSYLHGVSTNIEGEDRETPGPSVANDPRNVADAGNSYPTGWPYAPPGTGFANIRGHSNLFTRKGPGGTAGVAVMSNVYYPAIDPYATAYRNAASATSLNTAPNLIPDEPNTTAPTPQGTGGYTPDPQDPLHPRPDFHPRPLVLAQAAVAGSPATADDLHSGQTGFALGLNGHFFDRQFAGAGGATQFPPFTTIGGSTFGYSATLNYNADGQHPLGDYHIWPRTPGYSNIGTRLANPGVNLGLTYSDTNNQVPDGARNRQIYGLTTGNDAFLPPLAPPSGTLSLNGDMLSDDINPAAQDIAWIYTGSDQGVVYAYTPAVFGYDTGLEGGTAFIEPGSIAAGESGLFTNTSQLYLSGITGARPQIDIYTQTDLNAILASLNGAGNTVVNRGSMGTIPLASTWPQQSIAAKNGHNFYEWGETVYILVYDLLAKPFTNGMRPGQRFVSTLNQPAGGPVQGGYDRSVILTITSKLGTTQSTQVLSLQGTNLVQGTGNLLSYYYDSASKDYKIYDSTPGSPNAPPAGTTPLGVSVYRYRLGGNPGPNNAQTPGDLLSVTVTQTIAPAPYGAPAPGTGEEPGLQAANNPAARFSIANPLAVAGVLTAVLGNNIVPVTLPPIAAYHHINGVGPFESYSNQFGHLKDEVSITNTPDIENSEYWQALTNGNTIRRTDTRAYILSGPAATQVSIPNPNYGNPITLANGKGVEPAFYIPVAASAGLINHGTSGSTAGANNQQYLRIGNRSLLGSISKVRVSPYDQPGDLLFRSWPGTIMNQDADPQTNPRLTPLGMDNLGRINPLPWEGIPAEPKPWNQAAPVNHSLDYPDVQARKNNAVQVIAAAGDLTTLAGSLSAVIANDPASAGDIQNNTAGTIGSVPATAIPPELATAINITMPKGQPANLVAAHTLTSTYVAPNKSDFPASVTAPIVGTAGPVQLPAKAANRVLLAAGTNQQVVTPFGYTSRMVVFIDNDGTNRLNPLNSQNRVSGSDPNNPATATINQAQKAYREFEVWAGVPVDQSLKIVESVIDLGALPHSFGVQNGLLGYDPTAAGANEIGLTPLNPNYQSFFKTFTVQNTGNVNDYNLRASQRTEVEANNGSNAGTGFPFNYFLLNSATVDPRFGILASGADPGLKAITNGGRSLLSAKVMPQIVTSLDPIFDSIWDAYTLQSLTSNPNLGNAAGTALYNLMYSGFAGRHSLHKPRVSAQSASVLGIPDVPSNQTLAPGAQIATTAPAVAIAVPLGTPVGAYSSSYASSPFTIFEDHDTPNYVPTPFIAGGGATTISPVIVAAGPLYHGQNAIPPGAASIFSGNGSAGEGTFRAQSTQAVTINGSTTYRATYLPYTYPYLTINAKVIEEGLTGQFPDLGGVPGGFNAGVLPGIDAFPVVTADSVNGSTLYRPSSALTPASWRDQNGNMHVYFSRNDSAASGARPGAPYLLYHSQLTWDAADGTWQAANAGTPVGAAGAATGHWLTSPVMLPSSGAINGNGVVESNTSPYVLTHVTPGTVSYPVDQATLFFLDSVPTGSGLQHNRIFYVDVTSNGVGAAPVEYFTNADPSLTRYAPRAAFDSVNSQDFLMYYGGTAGKWSIYYVPRPATNGLPSGTVPDASKTPGIEQKLTMPRAIVSASEPAPIFRQINVNGTLTNFVDIYYSGISRTTQTPDIYMNRYGVAATGQLTLASLSNVSKEPLASLGRNGVWRAQGLAWVIDGSQPLPSVTWRSGGPGGTTQTTVPNNWKYDASTGVLYQVVQMGGSTSPTTLTYIYVDASAGTVQFRGRLTPSVSDPVTATYTPQTARLTSDGASNYGAFTMLDPQTLPATPTGQGLVLRRQQAMLSGRNYLLWQKGTLAGKAPTLYHSVRRVGIDLTTDVGANSSILFGQGNATNDQIPVVASVTVNGNNVPYDVDFINNRIYVEPQWEGQPVTVNYTVIAKGQQGGSNGTAKTTNGVLAYLDELNVGAQGSLGAALPITAGINEGQASALIDLYDWVGLKNSRNDPPSQSISGAYDPALAPGRVWILWTSPRGRVGQQAGQDAYPSGFNLYWETIAPNFEGAALFTPITAN